MNFYSKFSFIVSKCCAHNNTLRQDHLHRPRPRTVRFSSALKRILIMFCSYGSIFIVKQQRFWNLYRKQNLRFFVKRMDHMNTNSFELRVIF